MNKLTQLPAKAVRYVRLPADKRYALRQALRWLVFYRARVHRVNIDQLQTLVHDHTAPLSHRHPLTPARIAWAVSAAARLTESTCFPQALTTYTLLMQSGHTAALHIGVRKTPDSGFSAHAWVTHDSQIINGHLPDLATYTPLPSILE